MEIQRIEEKIFEVRGHKVMLDFDLAELYGTETKRLKEAVRRNISRFPRDFMFELTNEEAENLRTQFATSSQWGGRRYSPFAFTEQGVAMLSSVLKSDKAIEVNIAIMRAFVFMRQYALTHKDLTEKLTALEQKYDKQFDDVYGAIEFLMRKDRQETEQRERKRIGYRTGEE
ncbi:MAG: ORF6N domain-containing protein [Flavobacteriales bacterium]|nr:ORF6N domain-containing protein [Flavobacteriales bacterium]